MNNGSVDIITGPSANISKVITYNGNGTINTVTDAKGAKTMAWSSGILTGYTGTGIYPSKTFTYSSGRLTDITVT